MPDQANSQILDYRLSLMEEKIEKMEKNIETLVALKHKGSGILWVASIIVTAVFTTMMSYVNSWFK